ncbi:MAG: NAD(+) diphosphatase [Lachnospiraceae bacterium]|nr:NAD(+) diphosphatase [Lachnospiraceae bacterium]
MIQDIYPHKLINRYDPLKKPDGGSCVMAFRRHEVLFSDEENRADFPTVGEFDMAEDVKETLQFLFSVDDRDYYMLAEDAFAVDHAEGESAGREESIPLGEKDSRRSSVIKVNTEIESAEEKDVLFIHTKNGTVAQKMPEGYSFRDSRSLRRMDISPRENLFAEFTGHQIYRWYRDNHYCGTCGGTTRHSSKERAVRCTNCGRTIYPRILPAVIVAVTSGDRILMTKYADRPLAVYALVAGFVEIGEALEDTVRREVMEEVGLKVKNIRYYKSQPWGVVDDILMGFYCEVDGDDTIRLDHNELKEGKWFRRDEVQLQPTDFSLTNEMMREFKEGRQ